MDGEELAKKNEANIYMLFAGWEVRIVKNCDRGLENAARSLPEAACTASGGIFKTLATYGRTLNRQITYLFFSCDKLAYKWVYATLSLAGLTCRLRTIVKKFNERTSE